MKAKHGFLFGFAVISMAAIFTFAGCDSDPDPEDGVASVKVKNATGGDIEIVKLEFYDGGKSDGGTPKKTVNLSPALELAVGETSTAAWELPELDYRDGAESTTCDVVAYDGENGVAGAIRASVTKGQTKTINLVEE
jgi:hypothetical protein